MIIAQDMFARDAISLIQKAKMVCVYSNAIESYVKVTKAHLLAQISGVSPTTRVHIHMDEKFCLFIDTPTE
jgi:hypothetical protein